MQQFFFVPWVLKQPCNMFLQFHINFHENRNFICCHDNSFKDSSHTTPSFQTPRSPTPRSPRHLVHPTPRSLDISFPPDTFVSEMSGDEMSSEQNVRWTKHRSERNVSERNVREPSVVHEKSPNELSWNHFLQVHYLRFYSYEIPVLCCLHTNRPTRQNWVPTWYWKYKQVSNLMFFYIVQLSFHFRRWLKRINRYNETKQKWFSTFLSLHFLPVFLAKYKCNYCLCFHVVKMCRTAKLFNSNMYGSNISSPQQSMNSLCVIVNKRMLLLTNEMTQNT